MWMKTFIYVINIKASTSYLSLCLSLFPFPSDCFSLSLSLPFCLACCVSKHAWKHKVHLSKAHMSYYAHCNAYTPEPTLHPPQHCHVWMLLTLLVQRQTIASSGVIIWWQWKWSPHANVNASCTWFDLHRTSRTQTHMTKKITYRRENMFSLR